MHLKLCSVLGLFFLWDKFCSGASMRSQSLGRLFSWGATLWCTQPLEKWHGCLCQHFSYTPLQRLESRKLPPVVLSSTSLLPWPISLGTKTTVCTPDTFHSIERQLLFMLQELAEQKGQCYSGTWIITTFFWTLAFDTEALCSVVKSWCHYETWNCTALLLVEFSNATT